MGCVDVVRRLIVSDGLFGRSSAGIVGEKRVMTTPRQSIRECGYSLAELAIVVTIIGLMLAMVLKGQSFVRSAEVDAVIGAYRDISAAVRAFKERYQYFPGDFPMNSTSPEIFGTRSGCLDGGKNGGNGNGRIDLNELVCVSEHLIRAGFLMGDPSADLTTKFGNVAVIRLADAPTQSARSSAGLSTFPSRAVHLVEFFQLPCEVAKGVDLKLDDGDINSGRVMASVSRCTTDNVASFAIPLQ